MQAAKHAAALQTPTAPDCSGADAGRSGPRMPGPAAPRAAMRMPDCIGADAAGGRATPQTPAAPDASCAEALRQRGAAALILRSCWSAH